MDAGKVKFLFKSDFGSSSTQMVHALCTAFGWLTSSGSAHGSRLGTLRIGLARTRELVSFLDQLILKFAYLVLQALVVLSQVLNLFF